MQVSSGIKSISILLSANIPAGVTEFLEEEEIRKKM